MTAFASADSPIAALAAKLAAVRRLGRTLYPSKPGLREFRWNPPLAEAEVRAFEWRHGIALPDGYRQFLIEGGNGGIGPYGGVLPLERWNETAAGATIPDDDLARASPLRPDFEWRESTEESERRFGCSRTEFLRGSIALAADRGMSARLIVAGPHRGRVVYFYYDYDLDALVPHYFVRPSDFLSWYGRWLDELLAGFDDVWSGYGVQFGYGVGGSEAEQVATLDRPDASAEERREALANLQRRRYRDLDDPRNHSRFQGLGDATLAAVRRHLDHDAPSVRQGALRLLMIDKQSDAEPNLVRAASDPDPSVRAFALVHLARWHSNPPWDLIRRGLDDPAPEVIRAALYGLREPRRLAAEDVRRLLLHPDPSVRDRAFWASAEMPPDPDNLGLILDFLADPDAEIRRLAARELGRLGDSAAVLHLIAIAAGEENLGMIDAAINALGMLGDRRAAPTLIGLAAHADPLVRHGAAGALGKLGDRAAIPSLQALLSDEAHPPRRNADEETDKPTPTSIADEARAALRALA